MTDILLADDKDLLIQAGDFVVGESAEQDIDIIAISHAGEIRQWPTLGFGLATHLRSSESPATFKQRLAAQLEQDGFTQVIIRLADPLDITAYRNA